MLSALCLSALGSILTLRGDASQISMNGAVLQASCDNDGRQARVTYFSSTRENVSAYLLGVPLSCHGVDINMPCAGDQSGRPSLFSCVWSVPESYSGQVVQTGGSIRRDFDMMGTEILGAQAIVDCSIPDQNVLDRLLDSTAWETAQLNLTVEHRASVSSPPNVLPFTGIAGGNLVNISTLRSCTRYAALGYSSGVYTIDLARGREARVYCNATQTAGLAGWSLVYTMCQNGGGSVLRSAMSHSLPVLPTAGQPVTSMSYSDVQALSPSTIRFASTFGESPGYMFAWSSMPTVHMQTLFDGNPANANPSGTCTNIGAPISGSSGASCSMNIQGNNGGTSETHDIPTLGCSCAVWGSDGMKWGQIDSLTNYNGVTHVGRGGWDHSAQTSNGCIHVYVR